MTVLVNGELVLYGFVGDNFWGDGFTARDVLDALAELGRDSDVTVRINSGGGYVDDGIAIFNALKAHKGKVTVVVDSMAASSASLIAMAGEERLMRTGSMMMIHDPSSGIWGTAEDLERFAKVLEKQADNLASVYAEVTGDDKDDVREDMKAELWMTAEEAVERGYATGVEKKKAKSTAAHDYRVYAHAPERLVALSERKNWAHEGAKPKAAASAVVNNAIKRRKTSMEEVTPPAETTPADTQKMVADAVAKALADSKARTKAILTHDEAKGRETLAEHFAHETEMTVDAVVAALKAAPKVEASEPTPVPDAKPSYEQQRLAAANLAMPNGGKTTASGPKISATDIYAMRRQPQKGA